MAEADDVDSRSERPTPKRIADARKRGEVPRSADLTAAAVTLTGAIALYAIGALLGGQLQGAMARGLQIAPAVLQDTAAFRSAVAHTVGAAAWTLCALLFILLSVAVVAPVALGGWNFSPGALALKWQRLDPLAGLRRVFGLRGWLELAKSLARCIVLGSIAIVVLWSDAERCLRLAALPLPVAINEAAHLCMRAL
ncbi:MAG: EscU/YscU/HrcU family type III secretion system export apparatus switch protein, partial [Steroidobacteraceae bacterium]|nr:EscU/YscU/HrcU family type III secretion system export apparatus switch protein [Steroidobacteraceae bacterium]